MNNGKLPIQEHKLETETKIHAGNEFWNSFTERWFRENLQGHTKSGRPNLVALRKRVLSEFRCEKYFQDVDKFVFSSTISAVLSKKTQGFRGLVRIWCVDSVVGFQWG